MRSLIDSMVELGDSQALVVIFCYHHHALVGLETYDEDLDAHKLRIWDFLPDGAIALDIETIRENRLQPGYIRFREVDLENVSRDALFQQLQLEKGFTSNFRTTACTVHQADYLVQLFEASRAHPPMFQPAGNYRSDSTGHNCITWAETHLKAAGITPAVNIITALKDSSVHNTSDSSLAEPEVHVKAINCSIM